MKRKCMLVFTILVLCGIAVSCSSLKARRVEDLPLVESEVKIDDTNPDEFYKNFEEFRDWIDTSHILINAYYDKHTGSGELEANGRIDYERTSSGAIKQRDDWDFGAYTIYYTLKVLFKDGQAKFSGEIYFSTYDYFDSVDVTDDAFQLFIDRINYIASFFEKEG